MEKEAETIFFSEMNFIRREPHDYRKGCGQALRWESVRRDHASLQRQQQGLKEKQGLPFQTQTGAPLTVSYSMSKSEPSRRYDKGPEWGAFRKHSKGDILAFLGLGELVGSSYHTIQCDPKYGQKLGRFISLTCSLQGKGLWGHSMAGLHNSVAREKGPGVWPDNYTLSYLRVTSILKWPAHI